ncbi:MAG: DUF6197 family protein, partial [Acidimicrobiales bacterium]
MAQVIDPVEVESPALATPGLVVMPVSEEARTLLGAAELLLTEGWCQGEFQSVWGRCAMWGIVETAVRDDPGGVGPQPLAVAQRLCRHLGLDATEPVTCLAQWNDVPGRTLEEVVGALR